MYPSNSSWMGTFPYLYLFSVLQYWTQNRCQTSTFDTTAKRRYIIPHLISERQRLPRVPNTLEVMVASEDRFNLVDAHGETVGSVRAPVVLLASLYVEEFYPYSGWTSGEGERGARRGLNRTVLLRTIFP